MCDSSPMVAPTRGGGSERERACVCGWISQPTWCNPLPCRLHPVLPHTSAVSRPITKPYLLSKSQLPETLPRVNTCSQAMSSLLLALSAASAGPSSSLFPAGWNGLAERPPLAWRSYNAQVQGMKLDQVIFPPSAPSAPPPKGARVPPLPPLPPPHPHHSHKHTHTLTHSLTHSPRISFNPAALPVLRPAGTLPGGHHRQHPSFGGSVADGGGREHVALGPRVPHRRDRWRV